MKSQITIVQVIQLMLAPGIMISACGLLLLAMNNKYSLVVNRIRLLNEEKRKMILKAGEREFTYEENIRLHSLAKQLSALGFRVKLVRNSVVANTVAVGFFVLTSLCIGLEYLLSNENLNYIVTFLFLAGMLTVLTGVIYSAYESIKGYEIIRFEVKTDE
jgi:VIT1/CCC1 family predicted Fe2+/Mn2+ transporter